MPSFVAEDRPPASHTDLVDLDPISQFDLATAGQGKAGVDGAPDALVLPRHRANTLQGSFDESSTSSTNASDLSDTAAPAGLNGGTRPTSMSSLPNGRSVGPGGDEAEAPEAQTTVARPWDNGTTMTVVDRTVVAPSEKLTNGTREADGAGISPTETFAKRASIVSTAAGSIQQSPIEFQRPVKGGGGHFDGSSSMLNLPASASPVTGFVTPAASLTPASPSPEPMKRTHSPHRFSSPPIPSNATASTSSLHPQNLGLKHRHTLEVPKLQPGRLSRDGNDVAYTSGRFSPTTATTPGIGVRRTSLSLVRRNTRSIQSDFPRDEIVPDEDAMRWAEAYRQKRASKRKRREIEDDDRVLVGTKIDEHHANYATAYNMLTGIRVSVSRTNAKLDRPLTPADFEAKQKSTFDIAGNELVPSAKYDFKFKDYAPWVFRHLRALFRLDPADYLMSLTGKYILSELGSPGKSGSFFYFSRDYKYIIKTIHHSEHKFLRKILKDYFDHATSNPNTLLSQFYGLHRVKMPYGRKIHFVVMNNLFPPHRDIHQTFDLKGSTVGRDYKEEDLESNPRATLKDLNWLRRHRHLELGLQKKRLFLDQLHRDVQLLKRLGIMDYSLLVGIHDLQRGNEENLRDKMLKVFNPGGNELSMSHDELEPHSVLLRTPSKLENARKARELRAMLRHERPVPLGESASKMPDELEEGQNRPDFVWTQDDGGFRATHEDNTPADEIYYLGVIDCLTHYGIIKKIENFWKGLSHDRGQISATPPDQYGDRFFHFIEGVTVSQEQAAREAAERQQAQLVAASTSPPPPLLPERERVASWNSSLRRRSNATAPPIPNYQPPPPPTGHGHRSPEALAIVECASEEARKREGEGVREEDVPERTLATTASGGERRESLLLTPHDPILPVVEEAAEAASTGGRSARSREDLKDEEGDEKGAAVAATAAARARTPPNGAAARTVGPPTPPKYLKPESQDSGYGGLGSVAGGETSPRVRARVSRESLNKELPPLPRDKRDAAGFGVA